MRTKSPSHATQLVSVFDAHLYDAGTAASTSGGVSESRAPAMRAALLALGAICNDVMPLPQALVALGGAGNVERWLCAVHAACAPALTSHPNAPLLQLAKAVPSETAAHAIALRVALDALLVMCMCVCVCVCVCARDCYTHTRRSDVVCTVDARTGTRVTCADSGRTASRRRRAATRRCGDVCG
jgi:hypothetical protein